MMKPTLDENLVTRDTLVDILGDREGSTLKKYQRLHVGSASFVEFLKYEILTFLLSPIPGALGYLLRKVFFKSLFAQVCGGTVIGPYVTLRCAKQISLGSDVFVDSDVVLDAKGPGSQINIGSSVVLGKSTIVSCLSAAISIGDDVTIGPHCHLRAGMGPISIGSNVTVGSHTVIISGNPSYKNLQVPMKKQVGDTRGINIGDDVWIGVGVRIIDGVKVGNGSVLGAGAVVIEEVPDYAIAAGVPAKVIGNRTHFVGK